MRTFTLYISFLVFPIIAGAQLSKKVTRYLPDHINLQFAGAIGFISGGVGYETKNHRIQGAFSYGYVPESVGGIDIHSVTAKLTWAAVTRQLRNDLRVDWLTAGILANYVFGKQYFLFDPDRYPFNYYGFPTAAHLGFFVGGAVYHHKFGLYYELGTTDRDILSYGRNVNSFAFIEILNVGFGVKYAIAPHDWQRSKQKKPPVTGSF